jgi:branched-chain amino acid transport system substrate-binding protein
MTNALLRKLSPLLLGSCLAVGTGLGSSAYSDELRIGFLAPTTGIYAQLGKDMVDGFQLYLDQVKGDFAGANVKFIVEDEQGKPATAVLKASKLIGEDKVHLLVGGLLASTGYALAPESTRAKVIYIASVPSADDLTQRKLNEFPYFMRSGWTSSQPTQPLAQWACEQGYKKIATVAADYAFGYESVGGFQKVFEDCGGKIIQKIWPPLGTKDFGPYISTLKADADAIFTLMVGPMALQFPKQLRGAGIKKPIVGGTTSYDEFALPFMTDEVIGDVSALQYSAALQTPMNEAFVKAFRAKFGKVPGYYAESNYTTALLIHEVMKKTGGKWPGSEQFIKIMASLKVDTPRGPVAFDDMRNPVHNIYIKKVEKKQMFGYDKAELWNTVIKTYPNVSQFWTYGKEKFLAQPVYDREFPPCKYCE